MRPRLFTFALLFSIETAALARPLPGVPEHGKDLAAFAPAGWTVETSVSGDLDGDAIPDAVVVLLASGDGDRARALVWLSGEKDGFRRVATNVGLAACFGCLGMKGGDATPELEINKRVLTVTQWGGSRESYGAVHRFRLEKGAPRLIGADHSTTDTLTMEGKTRSENYLTGVTVVSEEPAAEDEEGKPTGKKPKTTKTTGKKEPLRAFEDVTEYGER